MGKIPMIKKINDIRFTIEKFIIKNRNEIPNIPQLNNHKFNPDNLNFLSLSIDKIYKGIYIYFVIFTTKPTFSTAPPFMCHAYAGGK